MSVAPRIGVLQTPEVRLTIMTSVNTNRGAMVALQTLNMTNRDLFKTQNAISTGLKVATAKDNGAIWAIANKMRSDVTAYDRVIESNNTASAKVDVAISAGESIMELLNEMKGKALAASQVGLSASAQTAFNADFIQLRDQVTSIIANSTFDGSNMTNGAAAINNAISLGDSAGGNTITVTGANLSLGGTTVTVAAAADVSSSATALTALGQVNTSITNLGTQLATWGAGSKRLDMHQRFVTKLQDALTSGVGAMTDADLSKESAKLQSLQVKQQLGIQALSIANGAAQSALSLFR
jgi:flagellin